MICIDNEVVRNAFWGWYNGSNTKRRWAQTKPCPWCIIVTCCPCSYL